MCGNSSLGKNLVQRKRDAVRRSAINRPMPLVNLANAQRSRESKTVRRATHLRRRSDNVNIAHFTQGLFKLDQAVRLNAVVVCEQNSCHENRRIA